MTNADYNLYTTITFYGYLSLLLVNYLWFLPKAYREYKNKRPTHATRKVNWACGLGGLLTILCIFGMSTPWRVGIYFVLLMTNLATYIGVGHLWMRHQILSNPSHPLHELYSSMIMKGKD
ncbi:hypothetical protein QMK50_27195 [Pseudomonas sp. P5_152]|uniref:hypothetical protein n=1 Tax=Pseudomonas sp. P5_152 TaxID=3043442 RepID=UPI002A363450|nr:hypothetical protein [Pseudomonas sp. P5_152]MDX9668636.1 hypothetical protein [Pseudomonas sp. P5_152]